MTRRGPPGHLTRPSRGAFFLAASENSCHCPLPKSQLASARRANKPTLPNLPTLLPNQPTLSRGLPLPQRLTSAVSSACPLDEFSCLAWTAHRPAHVRRKICAADFPRRTRSCSNLRCRFSPLLAWLPRPPCLDQQSFPSSPGL